MAGPIYPYGFSPKPRQQVIFTEPKREVEEKLRRKERVKLWNMHKKFYEDNLDMIIESDGEKYVVVHDDGYGRSKIVASDSPEARGRYLSKLKENIRKSAYVPKGKVPEERERGINFYI